MLRTRKNLLALALVCLCGCRPQPVVHADRATVSGTVTFAQQPLPGGSVTFISTAEPDKRVTGILQSDGTFAIADVPIGSVRVMIDTEPLRVGAPQRYVKIPAKYAAPDTSFTYEVKAGENSGARFELE